MHLLHSRVRNRLQLPVRVTLAAVLAFVAACGSSGGDTTTPVAPSISLGLSSPSLTATSAATSSVNVNLTRSTGYTNDVTLAYSALPSGVSASFSPLTLSGGVTASTLTFTVSPTAVASSATITITAGGAGISSVASTALQLTVTVPTLTVSATSVATTPQGLSTTVPITIARSGGFTGAVALSAEGVPSGTTATFSAPSLLAGVTTSTLTLASSSSSALNTNTIVIRATGAGVQDATSSISYSVTSPTSSDYALAATPAALSVVAGAGSSSTIAINRTGAFAGSVAFALSGAPTGVAGTFSPAPTTTNSSTLSLTTTAATVPGTYTLTITGTSGALSHTTTISLTVTAVAGVSVALSPATLSVATGASAQTSVTVTRAGGLTGDAVITLEGAPTGVTLTPLTITGTGTVGTATINATAATVVGVYNVVLRSTVGALSGTAPLALTVGTPAGVTLAVTPASVTAAQGATANYTANITRTGGFAGTVNLAVTGLPTNALVTISPAAATGASATIAVAVGSGVAAGSYTGTLTGTTAGATPNAVTTFTLVVTATGGGGGGGGNIVYTFCDPTRIPLYFAVRDGASGNWTRVTAGSGNSYSATISNSVGGIAYVLQSGTTITTYVTYGTAAELISNGTQECVSNPATGKTVTGSVAGLGSTESATIALGSATASATLGTPNFTLSNVPFGTLDLLAVKSVLNTTTFGYDPNKLIIRRGLNPAAGSALPVLDFSTAEAVTPASAVITAGGATGSENLLITSSLVTANGTSAAFPSSLPSSTPTRTLYGVPSASLAAGDLHLISVAAVVASGAVQTYRAVITYVRDMVARTITLGAALTAPTITTSTSTVLRPRAQGTIQSDYNSGFGATFTQTSTNRAVSVTSTKAYVGASATTYDLEVPDLISAGYTASWGLTAGTTTTYSVSATGAGTSAPADGVSYKFGFMNGSVTQSAIRK